MKVKRFPLFVLFVVLAILPFLTLSLFIACSSTGDSASSSARAGSTVPDQSAPSPDGWVAGFIGITEDSYGEELGTISSVGGFTVRTVASTSPDAAKGNIVIYTSMYEDVFPAIERAMETYFPELNVTFVYGGTGQIQTRIEAEIRAGKLGCDILMVAEPPYSIELKERGILHPYMSPHASALAFEYDPEGYWYPVRVSNMVLAYNPARNYIDLVPQSYYEFAYDQTVRHRTTMSNPLVSGTAMVTANAIWDRYSYRYFERLGYQGVMIDSNAVSLRKLETGEAAIAMVLEESVLRKREQEGSPLEVIYPADGTVVIPSTIVIVNDNWNANGNIASAQAITDWFLSPQGQEVIVSSWMHSVRSDFTRYPYDSIPTSEITANTMPVVWENVYRNRREVQNQFQHYVMGIR